MRKWSVVGWGRFKIEWPGKASLGRSVSAESRWTGKDCLWEDLEEIISRWKNSKCRSPENNLGKSEDQPDLGGGREQEEVRLRRPTPVACLHFSTTARSGSGRRHLVRTDYDLTYLRTRMFVKVPSYRREAQGWAMYVNHLRYFTQTRMSWASLSSSCYGRRPQAQLRMFAQSGGWPSWHRRPGRMTGR